MLQLTWTTVLGRVTVAASKVQLRPLHLLQGCFNLLDVCIPQVWMVCVCCPHHAGDWAADDGDYAGCGVLAAHQQLQLCRVYCGKLPCMTESLWAGACEWCSC